MRNYDFVQGPFYSMLNRLCNYNFCGGWFCKIQCIYCLAGNFSNQPIFEVKLLEKDKIPRTQIPFYVLKISS